MKLLLVTVVALVYTSCSFVPQVSKIANKGEFLAKDIMIASQGAGGTPRVVNNDVSPNEYTNNYPSSNTYSNSGTPTGATTVLNTQNECSDGVTRIVGTNIVKSLNGVVAALRDNQGNLVKNFGFDSEAVRKQIRYDLINEKKLKLDMTGVPQGLDVRVVLCDYKQSALCMSDHININDEKNLFRDEQLFTVTGLKQLTDGDNFFGLKENLVLMDNINTTKSNSVYEETKLLAQQCITNEYGVEICNETEMYPSADEPIADEPSAYIPPVAISPSCDINHSPLLVDLNDDGVNLSSPTDGVVFDIKGDGEKLLVSWPNKGDDLFLTLPKQGKVNGVHELFGNNTIGPDRKKAANGFEALKKYDLNRDGLLDRKDPIFTKLRLWNDSNSDGISASSELMPLYRYGITAFDLDYVGMNEIDAYHNTTEQRSVAVRKFTGGQKLLMVFDVWFRGVNPSIIGK